MLHSSKRAKQDPVLVFPSQSTGVLHVCQPQAGSAYNGRSNCMTWDVFALSIQKCVHCGFTVTYKMPSIAVQCQCHYFLTQSRCIYLNYSQMHKTFTKSKFPFTQGILPIQSFITQCCKGISTIITYGWSRGKRSTHTHTELPLKWPHCQVVDAANVLTATKIIQTHNRIIKVTFCFGRSSLLIIPGVVLAKQFYIM